MSYQTITKPSFSVIGIFLHTSFEKEEEEISIFWEKFYKEGILQKIPNKKSNTIYAIYTDCDKSFKGPYSLTIGAEVANTENIPDGMVAKTIPESNYAVFHVEGLFPQSLIDAWGKIRTSDLKRKFSYDFEVYTKENQVLENPEVDIYIAV